MVLTEAQLRAISPRLADQQVTLTKVSASFAINTALRMAHFLAQCAHESADFAKNTESLYYTKAESVVAIFRTAFDIDRDHVVDPEEIELAKGFLRKPEKLANRAYAGRCGNRDEASGDGWRFRGRGWMGTTFRNNYRACSIAIYGDDRLLRDPDLLAAQPGCALSAGWYWNTNHCNAWADRDDVAAVSGCVNRGDPHKKAQGLAERAANLVRIRKILGA